MNTVSFKPPLIQQLKKVLNDCKQSIAEGIYLGQQQDDPDFSLIGCICFLPSMGKKRDIIYTQPQITYIKDPQQGGIVKEKILYKGYYFTVRHDRYGKFIYSPRIGRVSLGKAMRSSRRNKFEMDSRQRRWSKTRK
jgi:hypothetical protein